MTGDPKSRDPRLERVTSASLTDAMGRRHAHRAHVLDFVSPTPDRILFGQAVTIRFLPQRADILDPERHNFARQFYEAIGGEQPSGAGKVLVMSSSGHHDTSVGGGTKLSRLENQGLRGVLTDGRLRDFTELARYSFASWCTGEAVRWGGDVLMPCEEVNVPVSLRDIVVGPGDYVYVDKCAAVVIPKGDLDWVLDEAIRIEAADEKWIEEIRRENPADILRRGSGES